MKGQFRLDFIFGVVVFAVVIFFIASQVNNAFLTTATDSRIDSLKARAIETINFLAEDSGDPANWETDISNVKRIGLAYQDTPYELSKSKIDALKTDNCSLLERLNLGGYRLTIFNSTSQLLFCGFVGVSTVQVKVTRAVYIDNDFGNITLELW